MGAGNRYTLTEDNSELAIYVDTSCDCWESEEYDCECHTFIRDRLIEVIESLPLFQNYGWDDSRNACYYGEFYRIVLESGNHNEIVINLEFQETEYYGLQESNYIKVYSKIARHINKQMSVCVGHGWTSSHYEINELK